MRTIIAGSRDITKYEYVEKAVESFKAEKLQNVTVVISGTARGVDRLGEEYARKNSLLCEKYPADWDKHGRSAGYKRNELMAGKAEALIALWDGKSRGTKHMIDLAEKYNLLVYIYIV